MSSRGSFGPVRVSSRASVIAKPDDSPYYIGLNKVREDPYHRTDKPDGVIQLGLAENTVNFVLAIHFPLFFSPTHTSVDFNIAFSVGWF